MQQPKSKLDVIVVGGGQAGLSVGYHLKRQGIEFIILDGSPRIGDAWRQRWDSLRLFTPAKFSSLDGMPFPAPPDSFPTKDEMADYLEAYAAQFELPVLNGVRVQRLSRSGDGYRLEAGDRVFEADQVIVAMSNYQEPTVPAFARDLAPDVLQLHSSAYRNPDQLRPGPVLLVGAGNSGAEIAMELAKSRKVYLSGPSTGEIPFRPSGLLGRLFMVRLVLRIVFHRILTIATPLGRKLRPKLLSAASPLVRVKARDVRAMGVVRTARTVGVEAGQPKLDDGQRLEVQNVIWCSGYRTGFSSWMDLPVLNERGEPTHQAGIVSDAPGLYFVGLHFLYAMSSEMIHGVGRDAERIARVACAHARAGHSAQNRIPMAGTGAPARGGGGRSLPRTV